MWVQPCLRFTLDFYQCHVQTCLTVRSTHDSSALTHLQHDAVKTRRSSKHEMSNVQVCVRLYLEDLLDMRAAAEGGGGLSGLLGVACLWGSLGVEGRGWAEWVSPQEALLLLEEVFLWWLRSVKLEQREWPVLYPGGEDGTFSEN